MEELNFSLEEKRFILKFCHKNQINSENIKNFIKFLSPATYEEIKDIDFKHDDFYEFREQILNFRQILSENIKN